MLDWTPITRDLSLDLKASRKSEGTFSEELDRGEAIPRERARPKGPHDLVFAKVENYLEDH